MSSAKTYLTRCLLFLLFTICNAISLARAVVNNHKSSVYWLAGMLVLTTVACIYFLRTYLKSRKAIK